MNNFNDIQMLLEKYWEGETSLQEERQLKGYFASGEVDERLRPYAPLFQAIREEQTVQWNKSKVVPIRPQMYQWQGWAAAASVAILLAAGAWWLFSKPDANTILANQPPMEQPKSLPAETAAPEKEGFVQSAPEPVKRAGHPRKTPQKQGHAPEINAEEEAAMAEIKAALALVSSKIRKGRQEVAKGAVHLESVDRIFKKKEG